MRYNSWLIADILLLAVCLVLLFVDAVITQDTVLALVAPGGVFIFSIRVGRDLRKRRIQVDWVLVSANFLPDVFNETVVMRLIMVKV